MTASGVKPEQGIVTAIVAGFLISALGGSSVQVGGPAGAFIVIVFGIVERYGLTNLLISTALVGVLLFVLGLLKLGTMVRYVPVQIIIGFTNGIAVLIALSQLKDVLGLSIPKVSADFFAQIGALIDHAGSFNPSALAIGGLCVAGLALWPKLFIVGTPLPQGMARSRLVKLAGRVPGPVVALVSLTLATALLQLPIETIGTRFGGIPQGLPALELPPFSWASAKELVIPTITLALLGAVESLLCARVADQVSTLPKHDPNQELMAQGVANMIVPIFGGIPATGTIARTVTNVRAGATSPVSGMVHAVTLFVILLAAAPLASLVPLAALAGILMFVAWNMFEGHQFARLRQFSGGYRLLMVGTFVLTIVFDLTVAVEVGLVTACVFFIWRMGTLFSVKPHRPAAGTEVPPGVQVFDLYGSLFFGAVDKIEALPDQLPAGTRVVVLDMQRLVLMDSSGLDALQQMHRALQRGGIALVLANVNEQPLGLIRSTGFEAVLGRENIVPTLAEAGLDAAAATTP